jgi:hypothetical protein
LARCAAVVRSSTVDAALSIIRLFERPAFRPQPLKKLRQLLG